MNPLIIVPDKSGALAPGHSVSVLLLSLFLGFHNTIVILAVYMPEEEHGKVYLYP